MRAPLSIEDLFEAASAVPVVAKDAILDSARLDILRRISNLPTSAWQAGDETDHSWSEHQIGNDELTEWCAESDFVFSAMKRAVNAVGWINRFRQHQWIGAHKDAGGDLQLVCALAVASRHEEGAIWIGNHERLIPMNAGDILVFRADSIVHGTTNISQQLDERITLNLRLWL